MQSILVHVDTDTGFDARLQVALDLARAHQSYLTFLQIVSPPVVLPTGFGGPVPTPMMPIAQEQADEFKNKLESRLNDEDVRWDWVQEVGFADGVLLEHGAFHDLVLVGAQVPEVTGSRPSRLAGSMAIEGRSTVMVVPNSAKSFDASKPALVAWNGAPEAARAIRSSLPILRASQLVYVATVVEETGNEAGKLPPLDGAAYLARHGIDCDIVELPCATRHPADVLMEAAENRGAGYVVLGAYGHTRMFEMVFGGVTRRMLNNPPLPLILAH